MVLAATLVMLICMTFRLSYAFQGAIYALLISRENPRATLESASTMLLVTGIGAAYVLTSAWFVISDPMPHFFWVIVSLFVAFFVLTAMTNYGAAIAFCVVIILAVPLWDRHISAENRVEDTLRVVLAVLVGVVVTGAVELTFARMKPGDDIVLPIEERLAAVQGLLTCYMEDRPVAGENEKKITNLAMAGTSSLRRRLRRSDYSQEYTAQMSGVVALVGRLVDIAATLTQFSFKPSGNDQQQLRDVAAAIASLRTDLVNRRIPGSIHFHLDNQPTSEIPLLQELEGTVALIPDAFASSLSMDAYASTADTSRSKLVIPDAFTNPEHLKFALKGCLAASLCYIIYNSIDWPGISTAVTTCLLTALSTVGSSRQKQFLRFTGAIVGGFLFGMGAQIFILPYVDSITGFTVLFVLVTGVASWFMTSSPRLSYFGLQIAVAFYFVHLQEFALPTSLSVARDRVVGILLGLFMMWLVFDQLWGVPAALEMKKAFISNLRLLAQLAREPVSRDIRVAIDRSSALRETINAQFDKVRSLADGVLFEFGSSRQQDLALRDRIRRWQPQLRTLFLIRVALLKYRLRPPGFELPAPVELAQQEFDAQLAKVLDAMADGLQGKAPEVKENLENSLKRLEQTVTTCCSSGPKESLPAKLQTFLALSRSIESVTTSLVQGELALLHAPNQLVHLP
ncbi:MAG TPA: FUSC family protein [Candidatus Acidoferrum sp.]|nr:FUSC family protein [Candidatus Acidoferrum sp.]